MPETVPFMVVPVPEAVATANGEQKHLVFEVKVTGDGQSMVHVLWRSTNGSKHDVLTFDAYEWERLKKALGIVDQVMQKVADGGATFKIG
jgi:hypothetical protein